jgi:hypothetical protein
MQHLSLAVERAVDVGLRLQEDIGCGAGADQLQHVDVAIGVMRDGQRHPAVAARLERFAQHVERRQFCRGCPVVINHEFDRAGMRNSQCAGKDKGAGSSGPNHAYVLRSRICLADGTAGHSGLPRRTGAFDAASCDQTACHGVNTRHGSVTPARYRRRRRSSLNG